MRRLNLVLAALLSALALGAHAAGDKTLVVLPLDATRTDGKMTPAMRATLEEQLRDEAANALAGTGWTVMTGETTLKLLTDNGIDPGKCGEGSCHLETAKEMHVGKFLSGAVQFAEGEYTASIRLIDTKSGNILASARLEGATVKALRQQFGKAAEKFFARSGLVAAKGAPKEQVAAPPDATPPSPKPATPGKSVENIRTRILGRPAVPKPERDLQPGDARYMGIVETNGSRQTVASIVSVKDLGHAWHVYCRYTWAGGELGDAVLLEKKTLHAKGRKVLQGYVTTVDVTYVNGRALGTAMSGGVVQRIDADVGPLFGDGCATGLAMAMLPLAEGYTASVRNFVAETGKLAILGLRVEGRENVTVQGGTFDALRVHIEAADGSSNVTGWVDRASRLVVKTSGVDPTGARFAFELVGLGR